MDKATFHRLLHQTFWIPFATALILGVTLILEVQYLATRAESVSRSDRVIAVAHRLYRIRVDEETGVRAYFLTNDRRFLDPFHQEKDTAAKLETELDRMVADNPEQRVRNQAAEAAARAWSTWADQTMEVVNAGTEPGDLQLQLQGKELMDQYRKARMEFINAEEQVRDQRQRHAQRTTRFVTLSVVPLCILMAGVWVVLGVKHMRILARSFGAAIDTAERHAEDAQEQKEWFRTTLSSIGDAVIATDDEGVVTFINPVAEELTGWASQDAQGRPLGEVFRIINEQSREPVENPIDKVRRLNKVVGLANHTVLINRDSREFAIDDSGAPIFQPDGTMSGMVLVFRDVSRQRTLEAALHSNERLALAGRLSASIAHEIHNPLDTVGNLLFLIHEQASGQSETQQLIGLAQRELHHVTEVSKNMLSLHRESRTPTLVRLSDLIEGVVALIEETIAKGKRRIEIEHGFTDQVEGFPAELRQVLTNVIKNAVEATADGGHIKISTARDQENGREGARIQVTDDGTGIPEHMQTRLFSPFATTKETGTGLGLWVTRSIVERHDGEVRIASRADSLPGTTVSIFLPHRAA